MFVGNDRSGTGLHAKPDPDKQEYIRIGLLRNLFKFTLVTFSRLFLQLSFEENGSQTQPWLLVTYCMLTYLLLAGWITGRQVLCDG